MSKPMEQAVAAAIESYIHAPRVLSVSKVVRQLASVFPEQDQAMLIEQVRRSRRKNGMKVGRHDLFPEDAPLDKGAWSW
jgi:hypothetical protein